MAMPQTVRLSQPLFEDWLGAVMHYFEAGTV
jgi:hypothetical protein